MVNELGLLEPGFRQRVEAFLAELMRRRIYVVVIETLRSPERQAYLFATGKTRTPDRSRHLYGLAIDIVPCAEYNGKVTKVAWDSPRWREIGELGEQHGLVWGGRWTTFPDLVHFEAHEGVDDA